MKKLVNILVPLLILALLLGAGCTASNDTEANAHDAQPVEASPPVPNGGEYILGGGGGGVFAVDMFVKIDGIDGESTDKNHEGWIDVLAWSWDMSRPEGGLATSGGRLATGRVTHGDFSVVKTIDKSTPKLHLKCANGQHIPSVTLELCRANGEQETYMEYELTDVIVSSVSMSTTVQGGETFPIEEVSFNYGKIEWTYTEYDAEGKAKGTVEAGWDVSANQEL
jgi:type VI secretion system secreted protein Hcp